MGAATASITWGSLSITKGFAFSFSPMGIEPSVCVINSPPHVHTLQAQGSLTLTYDPDGAGGTSPGSVVFPNCRLERPRLSVSRGGKMWQLPIYDRRWKWRYGYINGSYNVKKPDGTYTREKTPRQLAALLLDEMGETGYDVSQLPNSARPAAEWNNDVPAPLLAQLCSALGCVVCLNPLTNLVEIWPLGTANTLPAGTTVGGDVGFTELAKPDTIRAVGEPIFYQAPFMLAPVGEDTDGTIKAIDDLSYKPSGGWETTDLAMTAVTGTYTRGGVTYDKRSLAQANVWKKYRVTGFAPADDWVLPGYDDPLSRSEIALLGTLVEEETQADGSKTRRPAFVSGTFTKRSKFGANVVNDALYDGGFSIDAQRAIVVFGEPVFKFTTEADGFEITPATIKLTSGFYVKLAGVLDLTYLEDATGATNGTEPLVIDTPGVQAEIVYGGDPIAIVADNVTAVDAEMQYYIDAKLASLDPSDAATIRYVGFENIEPDGVIRMIEWSKSDQGIYTTVGLSREVNPYVPTFDRKEEKSKAAVAQANERKLKQNLQLIEKSAYIA
jgi:hypothetical protein